MFRSNVKENEENKVVLTDIEANIFEKLLHFIYTDESDASEAEAFQLLVAADKYGLEKLKILCEEKILRNLYLEDAIKTFALASMYNLKKLKMKTFHIIRYFMNTSVFEFLCKSTESDSSSEANTTERSIQQLANNLILNYEFPIDDLIFLKYKTGSKKTLLPEIDIWYHTELRIVEKNTWTIENFRKCNFNIRFQQTISSYNYISERFLWHIDLCAVSFINERFKQIKLILEIYTNSSIFTYYVQYKFSILNIQNKERNIVKGSHTYGKLKSFTIVFCENVNCILGSDDLLHGDDLIICCQFLIPDCCENYAKTSVPECNLVSQLSSLLKDESFTDVVIKIGSQIFRSHKAILSCYSPYFATSIQERSCEKAIMEIDDIEPDTFEEVLSAMYSGSCELTADDVFHLLPLENKYRFFSTTSSFDEAFISALSVNNAVKAFEIAISQKAPKLQKYALQFLTRNSDKIIQSGLLH